MELLLARLATSETATLGILWDASQAKRRALAFSVEDEPRADKVPGETRIPAGRYLLALRRAGGMHQRYSERFGARHRGMLWLRAPDQPDGEVPGFRFIYVHLGNSEADTEGCICIARQADLGTMTIPQSTNRYLEVYEELADRIEAGEAVWLTVWDADGSTPGGDS